MDAPASQGTSQSSVVSQSGFSVPVAAQHAGMSWDVA